MDEIICILLLPFIIYIIARVVQNQNHQLRMEECDEKYRQWEAERQAKNKREEEASKIRTAERDAEFLKAVNEGLDVCWNCKTIRPRRCSCKETPCLEWGCDRSYDGKCRNCREIICSKSEKEGHDICWNCLTIDPDRCYCGNCINCYGGGGNECNTCSD